MLHLALCCQSPNVRYNNRSAVIQAADDQVQPRHHAERSGVLRVPRRRERGGQAASVRRDRALRVQALPSAVPRRGLPVPGALLLLSRVRTSRQVVRNRAEACQR